MYDMDAKERIRYVIDMFEGGNASRFAQRLGISRYAVSRMCNGKASVSQHAAAIAKAYPLVNPAWLVSGEGEPPLSLSELERVEKMAERLHEDLKKLAESLGGRRRAARREPNQVGATSGLSTPDLIRRAGRSDRQNGRRKPRGCARNLSGSEGPTPCRERSGTGSSVRRLHGRADLSRKAPALKISIFFLCPDRGMRDVNYP